MVRLGKHDCQTFTWACIQGLDIKSSLTFFFCSSFIYILRLDSFLSIPLAQRLVDSTRRKDVFIHRRPIRHPCPRRKPHKPILLSADLSYEELAVTKAAAE